jgi:16S rRNA (guanine527-N7)-methyltransferase
MKNWIDLVEKHLGIYLSDLQQFQFQVLEEELLEWNKKINLTAIRDVEGIRERHFFDSLTCFMGFEDWPESLIDVGSGAGFPGLPVKFVIPNLRLTLVESVDKKANFCRHIVEKLGLTDVTVLSKRAEEVARMPEHREAYDVAIARAVAPAATLAEYLLPLTKVGGTCIMQKGQRGPLEVLEAARIVDLCGGEISDLRHLDFEGIEGEGNLIILEKLRPTPKELPRGVGIPAKKPILSSDDKKLREIINKLLTNN